MKRILASLLAAIGATSAPQAAPKVETVDINSVRYSMPTVAADPIEFVLPTKESFQGAPQFHEDEWAQLEFFPKSRLSEIQKLLKEFKAFELSNRTQYGWNKIYARRISRPPVLPAGVSLKDLGAVLPAPILVTSSKPLGQVKNGFSVKLGENAHLYGLSDNKGTSVLAAHLAGADDMLLTRAFTTLNRKYALILVDWRQQLLLVSVAPTGEIDVWRP
ncbi:MAG: hypothetical protein ACKOF9_06380 [Burkholderiales bacterium]